MVGELSWGCRLLELRRWMGNRNRDVVWQRILRIVSSSSLIVYINYQSVHLSSASVYWNVTRSCFSFRTSDTHRRRTKDKEQVFGELGRSFLFPFQGILYNLVEILADDTRSSEINITSHDGQISKWLEQTFSSKQQPRRTTAAGRFESIRAIIQASSFVNALQKQIRQNAKGRLAIALDLPVDINELNLWSFNLMEYEDPLTFSILLIFDAHDLISRYHIDIDVLKSFSRALTEGYQSKE